MSKVLEEMKTRRSIRKFKPDMIPQDILDRIIEAGTFAANGRGAQNTIIIQVTNKEIRDEIAKRNADIMGSNTDPFYGAPVILIVLGKKDWPTHVYDGSLVNTSASSQRVPKDGQRNSTEFHGMVENQSMISETGHRSTRRWERVLRCLRMRWQS